MGRVPPPKEPNGCLQTAVISRMIAQILFVPLLLIFGGILFVVFAFYAFAEHVLLGFGLVVFAGVVLAVIARWEYERVKRDLPPPDDVERIDPRMR
jgi:hypothetical protein